MAERNGISHRPMCKIVCVGVHYVVDCNRVLMSLDILGKEAVAEPWVFGSKSAKPSA